MAEKLLSVGLDVGTTTTQMVVSEILAENRASGFAVPDLKITQRRVVYQSPVRFTPLLSHALVDGEGIRDMVAQEYAAAGIRREDVDTGAIIITGETSRKENAAAVAQALSQYAGDFVVATAGPDLESILAAKGAGAVRYSEETGKTVLHFDIGGGTSNLALIRAGRIVATTCLNVGGRLLKFDEAGTVTYVSPAVKQLCTIQPGDRPQEAQVQQLAKLLVSGLEMAAGLRQRSAVLDVLTTPESGVLIPEEGCVMSFSGGVADCVRKEYAPRSFGDMGPALGSAIRESLLCKGDYMLGEQTIRATVIGAGCHSTQLSGSTVFYQHVALPMKNLPVVRLTVSEQALPPTQLAAVLRGKLASRENGAVVSLPGFEAPSYGQVKALAEGIAEAGIERVLVAVEADMAKALGHALALHLPSREILCIDRVRLEEESFLDVGQPIGPALPVVVKTLIFSTDGSDREYRKEQL